MSYRSHKSLGSSSSAYSNDSNHTQSTAPTSYYGHHSVEKHQDDFHHLTEEPKSYDEVNRRASTDTYASTIPSTENLTEERRSELPRERSKVYSSDAIPATAPDFAELFPSTRRLLVAHDDSTYDGNMNLRVDTEIMTSKGRSVKITLFHLRMTDLKERKFSLRRYCRESGREVCHSAKKYVKPTQSYKPKRPSLPRSISTAIQNIGRKSASPPLRRYDSGYESDDDDEDDAAEELHKFTCLSDVKATIPTNIIRLEFGNYAQVQIQRFRGKSSKSYDFEYWGHQYQWQRDVIHDHESRERVSYDLVNLTTGKKVAYIEPEHLSYRQTQHERSQGAWIPPCSMKITDRTISDKADLADVIVATGLIAMTDDHMKRR